MGVVGQLYVVWGGGGTYVCSLNFKYGNMVVLCFEE